MKISQKTKDIIFYVLAGLFVAGAITCTICEAVLGKSLPTWASVLLCVSALVFAVVGTILTSKSLDRFVKREIKKNDDVVKVKVEDPTVTVKDTVVPSDNKEGK